MDVVPSPSTDIVLDLTHKHQVYEQLSRFEGGHLIHGAFPLPGTVDSRSMLAFAEKSSESLLSIPWLKRWVISSTAVYPTSIESFSEPEPWEVYGEAKLAVEEQFVRGKDSSEAMALRLGTLLSPESDSFFSRLVRSALRGQVTPFPRGGRLVHPISSAEGVARWIASSMSASFAKTYQVLLAQDPISIRDFLDSAAEGWKMPRFFDPPRLQLNSLDRRPFLGLSSWHLNAMYYDVQQAAFRTSAPPNAALLDSYSQIFEGLRTTPPT